MAYTSRMLVVARQTAGSDDLREALLRRAERGPVSITVLMPAPGLGLDGRSAAQPDLDAAVARLRDAGLDVNGVCGDHDPVDAVVEIAQPGRFDEVLVATLPDESSKWLRMDLPRRIGRVTDLPVTHVSARPPGHAEHRTGPPPQHEREPLGPLGVLAWSHPRQH
jgi:hypothetical protein